MKIIYGWDVLLFFLFLGLKLGNAIDWSWWWVTAPIWGPLAFWVACVALLAICVELFEK